MSTTELVVSGLGVVTPWTDRPRRAAAPPTPAPPPDDSWFDVTARLGPRGYRYLPAASAYLLAATRAAVADAGGIGHVAADARAAVVATNHAATGVLDGMDDTVTREGSDGLSPALAPYFSINTYVGRVATEYETRAFAVTLTSPAVAGFDALALAATSLARGRAGVLVVGTTEARLPAGHRASGADETGAAALVLEPAAAARARGARVHGTVRARTLCLPDGQPPSGGPLAAALDALLKDGDRAPLTVHLVADDSPVAELTAQALKPHGTVRRAPLGAGCLAPALRLVQSLASDGERHLVAVAQGTGHVALALVTAEEAA
ncbi:beta-ketoacyl synthase N-terminal-like domain-containing protein [Streptomyces sp. NPDC007991]|uniref:beta-ketoacyl synthase N-terminal-like domain-containing protein n=1 Tax=Streptomyces sp. NPDC007991 TaxID=3364803 RepID=UPI0036E0ECBC